MSSRHYLRRVVRVPKDRGAYEAFGTLVVKALRKHGWPAKMVMAASRNAVFIQHFENGRHFPPDFAEAVSIAVRVVARSHRLDVTEEDGFIFFERDYDITPQGIFKEVRR